MIAGLQAQIMSHDEPARLFYTTQSMLTRQLESTDLLKYSCIWSKKTKLSFSWGWFLVLITCKGFRKLCLLLVHTVTNKLVNMATFPRVILDLFQKCFQVGSLLCCLLLTFWTHNLFVNGFQKELCWFLRSLSPWVSSWILNVDDICLNFCMIYTNYIEKENANAYWNMNQIFRVLWLHLSIKKKHSHVN